MNHSEYLIRLGLTEKEGRIYLVLLQLGEASVQEIADSAEIKRPTAYFIISSLLQHGLLAVGRRGNKTVYSAAHPKVLQDLVEKKEKETAGLNKDLIQFLPELEALYKGGGDRRPVIKYYEGHEGQVSMRKEASSDSGHDIYSFVALDDLLDSFPKYDSTHERSRIKQKVATHVVYTHKDGPQPDQNEDKKLRESRYIPKDLYPFSGSLTVNSDAGKAYISIYRQHYIGIVIENKTITQMLFTMWKLAWEAAKPYNT